MWTYILTFIAGASCTTFLHLVKVQKVDQLRRLKNALLTFALVHVVNIDKFITLHDYGKYDGQTLPPIAGSNLTNACFTYIVDSQQSTWWCNATIKKKQRAIDLYLATHLSSENQVIRFFEQYVAHTVGYEIT